MPWIDRSCSQMQLGEVMREVEQQRPPHEILVSLLFFFITLKPRVE